MSKKEKLRVHVGSGEKERVIVKICRLTCLLNGEPSNVKCHLSFILGEKDGGYPTNRKRKRALL